MKVGSGYTSADGRRYYWQCANDGTNFKYHFVSEDGFSFTDREAIPAPPEIKCWGDVAHMMGEDTVSCKECKQRGELSNWAESYQKVLKERELCFDCNLWAEKIEEIEHGKTFYITDKFDCYSLGPEPSEASWKRNKGGLGFGGSRFEFELHADREHHIVSHNVWYGGVVPEHFRDRLKVNCTIIPRASNDWSY